MKGSRLVTDFECSINAVRAVASFLRGEDHGGMSTGPSSSLLAAIASKPPEGLRSAAPDGFSPVDLRWPPDSRSRRATRR